MSSFKTSKLKYTVQRTKPLVPHSMFGEAQAIRSKAILKQQCNSGKNSAPQMRISFSLPLLLLPWGPKKGLEAHSPTVSKKHWTSTTPTRHGRNMYSTQGLPVLQNNKWHCQKEKRLHLRTLWPSKSVRLHNTWVLSVLLCVQTKSADAGWTGKRETENLKWGTATLLLPESTLFTLLSYGLQDSLTTASTAWSLRSLSVIKF